MRTAAWEIALRDCSKEAVGEGLYKILVKGRVQCIQALTLQKVFC